MRTFPQRRPDGSVYAFEINHFWISKRRIVRLLNAVDGVSDVRIRKFREQQRDARIYFKFHDWDYVVWEPYGDSSRYWFGPAGEENTSLSIDNIENAFKDYRLPSCVKLLVTQVSLDFEPLLGIYDEATMRK